MEYLYCNTVSRFPYIFNVSPSVGISITLFFCSSCLIMIFDWCAVTAVLKRSSNGVCRRYIETPVETIIFDRRNFPFSPLCPLGFGASPMSLVLLCALSPLSLWHLRCLFNHFAFRFLFISHFISSLLQRVWLWSIPVSD